MPGVHALLSASAAERWLNCPPSARLTEKLADTPSEYAAEGTLAHALGELKLRKNFESMKKSVFDKAKKTIEEDPKYTAEMGTHTDAYLEYILGIVHGYKGTKPYVAIEKQVDYSGIAPEGFGTADCLIFCGEDIHVIDFKYGKGVPVSPENNSQLKLYAWGACRCYAMLYSPKKIHLHIVQPGRENLARWEISLDELNRWGEEIRPIATLAFSGGGDFKEGDWCRFCKVNGNCRVRAGVFQELENGFTRTPATLLSAGEIGGILKTLSGFKSWAADIEEFALSSILKGLEIPGWKAVEGCSRRVIDDVSAVIRILAQNGFEEAIFYTKKPVTLTEMEKIVTKPKLAELVGEHIQKPLGKPTLVPAYDKRQEFTKTKINEYFGGNNND